MSFPDLSSFLGQNAKLKGPIALIFMEDAVEVASTLRHHLASGFKAVVALGSPNIEIDGAVEEQIHRIDYDMTVEDALLDAVNAFIKAYPTAWIFYCYNSEYLFFPFCETRSVGEMAAFAMEERRPHLLTYVIDLYAGDLWSHPNAVSIEDAHLDRSGYYALARKDAAGEFKERQLDFFGGLRWRFEEHIPTARRRIDRIALFQAKPNLTLLGDHTLNDPEMNTYACPWHHSLTAAIASFRTAKALKRNPGSSYAIETFKWRNSAKFNWHSQQLMDLGLMEPGQWF
ncbi:hypothetical protein SAMN05444003_1704 [Cognatiyoonia sediminum]|uniref:Uncharacterized protein n=1 Tax=Cognatiyoonia sediminum TaxID=1508389 RepID=A0A1M5PLN6_9RHOB|nr:hypothetical protein [Cognatiyoonia sediminum]SHH02439.1 hypothetical protein SAMN05444003_1704 [Cognatiyoonia sediminum]